MAPRPSTRTSVISETTSASSPTWRPCLITLDAITQATRQVLLDRGALLQFARIHSPPIQSSEMRSRSILAKDARVTWIAKPVPTMAAQWVPHGVLPLSIVASVPLTSLFAMQIGDWDVSSLADFSRLFIDDSWKRIDGADSFNEPLNWDTGTWRRQ